MHLTGFAKSVAKLLFKHSVVSLDNLLGEQLLAVFRRASLLELWSVLPWGVRSFSGGALCFAPNVKADASANVFFSSSISRHAVISLSFGCAQRGCHRAGAIHNYDTQRFLLWAPVQSA